MKKLIVAVLIIFILLPRFHSQAQPPLSITEAYARTANWTTYRSQTEEQFSMALVLQTDTAYQFTRMLQRQVDASYDVPERAVQARWQQDETQQHFDNSVQLTAYNARTRMDVIGVDSRLYVQGDHTLTPDLNNDSRTYDTYTFIPLLAARSDLRHIADYNMFRVLDDLLVFLPEATLIEQTLSNNRTLIQVTLPASQAIPIFRLNIDEFFDAPALTAVERDKFYDLLPDNSQFLLTVEINALGQIITENIQLTIAVQATDAAIMAGDGSGQFQVMLNYQRQIQYREINSPIQIQEP